MSDQKLNRNVWADKLEHLPVPGVNDSWKAMAAILDNEMPVRNKDRRPWWLLLFLLLLLGVCNCPGILRINKSGLQKENAGYSETMDRVSRNKSLRTNDSSKKRSLITLPKTKQLPATQITQPSNGYHQGLLADGKKDSAGIMSQGRKGTMKRSLIIKNKQRNKEKFKSAVLKNTPERRQRPTIETNKDTAIKIKDSISVINSNKPTDAAIVRENKIPKDTTVKEPPALQQRDSSKSRVNKDSSVKKERGFVVGIGINQFFPLGQQQRSNYNSSGTSGVLTDYIPVPQLRYYLNKRLYLQTELQFNTPQYTRQLLIKQTLEDSVPSGRRLRHSVFIKKLFYFNVPLSVHYSPMKNAYLGAGLQYARLNNAVALLEDNQITPNRPDTVKSAKIQGIKTDSVYQLLKTSEWRLMIDASYHWKKLIFGLRYNQALSSFINVPVSNTVITQSRNNSLQLYLRYDLWDGRKKR